MNKAELIEKVAEISKASKAESGRTVDAVFDAITEALKENDRVVIAGFGTFSVSRRSSRMGRNPQTGEVIHIDAKNVPKFSAGKKLKDAVK
jgi:DNA-binding protein HU-beta